MPIISTATQEQIIQFLGAYIAGWPRSPYWPGGWYYGAEWNQPTVASRITPAELAQDLLANAEFRAPLPPVEAQVPTCSPRQQLPSELPEPGLLDVARHAKVPFSETAASGQVSRETAASGRQVQADRGPRHVPRPGIVNWPAVRT
jgi:hypothetical protein